MKTTLQNRKSIFNKMQKNNKFSNIRFNDKKPQNEVEREYFKVLNNLLKELSVKCICSHKREIKSLRSKKYVIQTKGWHIEINGHSDHFLINEDIEDCNYLNLNIKASLIWQIFGKHYSGTIFKNTFTTENKLRIDLMRMWKEKYWLSMRVKSLETQIAKVMPVKGLYDKTKVNSFMRRKSAYKLA